jgi:hypothetical protein
MKPWIKRPITKGLHIGVFTNACHSRPLFRVAFLEVIFQYIYIEGEKAGMVSLACPFSLAAASHKPLKHARAIFGHPI